MLKISVIDRRTERRLVLEGKLIAPWIAELRTAWQAVNGQGGGPALVVDLRNVTGISQEGENARSPKPLEIIGGSPPLDNFLYRNMLIKSSHGLLPDCRQSGNHLAVRRLVRIRAWHPCGMASKNLEMNRTFALSSTPSLRWHGPLVQTAPQTSSISAGWTIRVYLQGKLWAGDGRLRFIQTTWHECWKHSGKL